MPNVEFRRKLYQRGSSFETTIPMPLLFALDKAKKYNVVFLFDSEANRWHIQFEETSKQSFETSETQSVSERLRNGKAISKSLSTRVDKIKKPSIEGKLR